MQKKKAFLIEAYYDDLERRISFLNELHDGGHSNEALMLCCCYIEALGSQRYRDSDRNAENYCTVLIECSGNILFGLVHPRQALKVLSSKKLFGDNLDKLRAEISIVENQLWEKNAFVELLIPIATLPQQKTWLNQNAFKFTIAFISYSLIRSELVHDISTSPISFSETKFNGKSVPRLNFQLLYEALKNVFNDAKRRSLETTKWYFEQ